MEAFEAAIGYSFSDRSLLKRALTHSSHTASDGDAQSNERLEYLGDAVLELIVTHELFFKYSGFSEGKMTRLRAAVVSEAPLAEIARALCIGDNLLLGKGAEKTGIRQIDSVLSDALEALIGAVYLDGGLDAARAFVLPKLSMAINKAVKEGGFMSDYKTRLQEHLQASGPADIRYQIISESGQPHNRVFEARVVLGNRELGRGSGVSKKSAEQQAALMALKKLGRL